MEPPDDILLGVSNCSFQELSALTKKVPALPNMTTTACEQTALAVVEPLPFDLIRQYEGTPLCVLASFVGEMDSENLVRAPGAR